MSTAAATTVRAFLAANPDLKVNVKGLASELALPLASVTTAVEALVAAGTLTAQVSDSPFGSSVLYGIAA